MARFIELPHGKYNAETNTNERTAAFVNLDRIISIKPDGEYMCKVTLAGGNIIQVYHKYDTMKAMITNKPVEPEESNSELFDASFQAGVAKGRAEADDLAKVSKKEYETIVKQLKREQEEALKQAKKDLISLVEDWFSTNPMTDGWLGRLKKVVKKGMLGEE